MIDELTRESNEFPFFPFPGSLLLPSLHPFTHWLVIQVPARSEVGHGNRHLENHRYLALEEGDWDRRRRWRRRAEGGRRRIASWSSG